MINFIRKYILYILLGLVLVIMLISLVMTKMNNSDIKRNLNLKAQAEDILQTNALVLTNILHSIDLGLRGFAITKSEPLLQPLLKASESGKQIFGHLEAELDSQNYNKSELNAVKAQVQNYYDFCYAMVEDVRAGRMDTFLVKLNQDKGFYAWKAWDEHSIKLNAFEHELIDNANRKVEKAMSQNFYLKIILLLFSVPTFALALFTVNRENKKRNKLMIDLEKNNREYLFNPGTTFEGLTEAEILNSSIANMRQTADFVKQVAGGNYENTWNGLDKSNQQLNNHTIAGELLQMQKQMKEVKIADSKKLWANEGLTRFSEIIRNHQENPNEMFKQSASFLSKHLKGWQSGLYLRKKDVESGSFYLEICALYAADNNRNKHETINPGEGIIGQAYMDASPIYLNEVPESYWKISSGIGELLPTNVLVVPFQFNKEVRAVFEIASFEPFTEVEITFLEKAGEYFASATSNLN